DSGAQPRQIGAPCAADADCDSSSCYTEGSTLYPGGMCTQACDVNACPSGSTCVGSGTQSACFPACFTTSECRNGYVCSTFAGVSNVCVPQCSLVSSVCGASE